MAPIGFTFLANRGNLTKVDLFRTIRDRLTNEPGCAEVRISPSRLRPRSVRATVEPHVFLGAAYPADEATLEVRFSYPQSQDYEYYVIQWSEPHREFAVGWHRDADHPDLGECHVQLDFAGETIDRRPAAFVDEHPLNVLETRLDQFRSVLPRIDWETDRPELPSEL